MIKAIYFLKILTCLLLISLEFNLYILLEFPIKLEKWPCVLDFFKIDLGTLFNNLVLSYTSFLLLMPVSWKLKFTDFGECIFSVCKLSVIILSNCKLLWLWCVGISLSVLFPCNNSLNFLVSW